MVNNNKIINVDTDAILICKEDQSAWNAQDQKLFLDALNAQFPEKIKFEHDGVFESVLVIASKNYALLPVGSDKIKIKGSSLKDQKREPAVKEMIDAVINAYMYDKKEQVLSIYEKYVDEVMNMNDIARWSSKKTITEAVLKCQGYEKYNKEQLKAKAIRGNEIGIWDAVKGEELIQSGDKIYVYPAILGESLKQRPWSPTDLKKMGMGQKLEPKMKVTPDYGLKQPKYYNDDVDKEQLLKRLFNTIEIFSSVVDDMSQFKNYSLVKNYKLLLDKHTKTE